MKYRGQSAIKEMNNDLRFAHVWWFDSTVSWTLTVTILAVLHHLTNVSELLYPLRSRRMIQGLVPMTLPSKLDEVTRMQTSALRIQRMARVVCCRS